MERMAPSAPGMPPMATMKSVHTAHNKIDVVEIERPTPGPKDALMRVRACGICGTDTFFLHIGGIDGGNMATTPYTVDTQGMIVTLERNLARDVAVPGTAKLFSMPVGQVFSRRLRSQSFLPNLHLISNTIGFPDEPERQPNVRLNIMPITPASRNRLYQFVVIATSYPVDVTKDMKDQLWSVFSQDQDALEAIQAGYDEFGPDLREISVKADAAAVSARRILARLGRVAAQNEVSTAPLSPSTTAADEAHL
jgi:hypothetical protein